MFWSLKRLKKTQHKSFNMKSRFRLMSDDYPNDNHNDNNDGDLITMK